MPQRALCLDGKPRIAGDGESNATMGRAGLDGRTYNMVLEDFLALLHGVKPSNNGFLACCPSHKDDKQSLSVKEGDDGRILVNCFAECEPEEIVNALGLNMSDLFSSSNGRGDHHLDRPSKSTKSNIEAVYDYHDKDGNLPYQVLRMNPKNFLQRRPYKGSHAWGLTAGWYEQRKNGQWYKVKGSKNNENLKPHAKAEWLDETKKVLYKLPMVIEAVKNNRTIFICEGEKDVFNVISKFSLIATTSPGGGGKDKWLEYYGHHLKGAKIVILPDNDPAGQKYADDVAYKLRHFAGSIKIINLPGLKEKQDVSDYIENGGTREDLIALVEAAEPLSMNELEGLSETAIITSKENKALDRFYSGKSFIYSRLGQELLQELRLKKGYDQLWFYKDGVYQANAESILRKRAVEILGEEYRPGRVEAACRYILDILPEEEVIIQKEIINLKNGRLHWRTGELFPHDPDIFEVSQLPVEYKSAAVCKVFDKYLESTLAPEIHPLIEEVMGYLLIPDTATLQKAFMFYGPGGNGKGVLLNVIEKLIGESNVSHIALQALEEDKFKAAELLSKLVNIFADLDSRALQGSSHFKTLTAGDAITGERKYGQPFKFRNYARLLFSANQIPGSNDRTYAFYRRWTLIPFEKTFREGDNADVNLSEKLTTPEELSGILNRALIGLRRLFNKDKPSFTVPIQVSNALDDYQKKNDVVAEFIDECVERLPEARIEKKYLYRAFKFWCNNKGYTHLSEKIMVESLKRIVPNIGEVRSSSSFGKSSPRCWTGIALNEDAPDPDMGKEDHEDLPY